MHAAPLEACSGALSPRGQGLGCSGEQWWIGIWVPPTGPECGRAKQQGTMSAGLPLPSLPGLWFIQPASLRQAPHLVVGTTASRPTLQQGPCTAVLSKKQNSYRSRRFRTWFCILASLWLSYLTCAIGWQYCHFIHPSRD